MGPELPLRGAEIDGNVLNPKTRRPDTVEEINSATPGTPINAGDPPDPPDGLRETRQQKAEDRPPEVPRSLHLIKGKRIRTDPRDPPGPRRAAFPDPAPREVRGQSSPFGVPRSMVLKPPGAAQTPKPDPKKIRPDCLQVITQPKLSPPTKYNPRFSTSHGALGYGARAPPSGCRDRWF